MRKLKGIMINGEWLGERVAINGFFRAICNISPVIILEFVKVVNKLETKSLFTITSFELTDSDTAHINFENKDFSGYVDLTFFVINNNLVLKTSFLNINSEIKTTKKDDLIDFNDNINNELGLSNTNFEEVVDIPLNKEENVNTNFTENFTENFSQIKDLKSEFIEQKVSNLVHESPYDCHQLNTEICDLGDNRTENVVIEKRIIEVEVEKKEGNSTTESKILKESTKEDFSVGNLEEQGTFSESKSLDNHISNDLENKLSCVSDGRLSSQSEAKIFDENILNDFTNTNFLNKPNYNQENKLEELNSSILSSENSTADKFLTDELAKLRDLDEKNSVIDAKVLKESALEVEKEETITFDYLKDGLDDDIAGLCLAEMYAVEEKNSEFFDNEVSTPDQMMMQALLAEMITLKDDIDLIKAESTKRITANEFFGGNDSSQSIKDEDADFRILSSTDKINAAILDEDCFFAGEKLYRWGETLYLED